MYEFIFWMCLASSPNCTMYEAPTKTIIIHFGLKSKDECKDMWIAADNSAPDPPGLKSKYLCRAMEEPL